MRKSNYIVEVTNSNIGFTPSVVQTTRLDDVTEEELTWFKKGVASSHPIEVNVTHTKL